MHKLEQIESFGAFLDFLSNPDEYKQLIKDVRDASKEHKELVEKQRKIKDIDAWRASEGARLGQVDEALKVREKAIVKRSLKISEEIKAANSRLTKDRKALAERRKDLDAREKAVEDLEKQKSKINKLEQEYTLKLANHRKESDKLKQKFAEIAAVAGG